VLILPIPFGAFQPLKPAPGAQQPSLRSGKQLKGWRREKKLNLIGTINPEFKDLATDLGMDNYSA
jgi:hypothetical protein